MPAPPRLPFDPIVEARRQWERHGWGDVATAMAAVTSIMRMQQVLLARADAILRPLDLTFARYEVLMLLTFSRKGALPLGKIGQRLQVNPASVTNAVDRLERSRLVERVPNPADGRGTLARLSPAGRRAAARATRSMNAELFGDLGLDGDDLERLFGLLQALRQAAGDFDVEGGGTRPAAARARPIAARTRAAGPGPGTPRRRPPR
ncbi:MAG: MarR family transcriptional regulator [Acidimicrobiales bacterium]